MFIPVLHPSPTSPFCSPKQLFSHSKRLFPLPMVCKMLDHSAHLIPPAPGFNFSGKSSRFGAVLALPSLTHPHPAPFLQDAPPATPGLPALKVEFLLPRVRPWVFPVSLCMAPVSPGGYKVPALLVAAAHSMVGMEALESQEFHPRRPTRQLPGSWEPNPANPTLSRAEGAVSSSLRCLRGRQGPAPSFPFGKEQTRNSAPSAPGNDNQSVKPGVGFGGSPPHLRRGSTGAHPILQREHPEHPHLPEPSRPPSTLQLRVFSPFHSFFQ